MKRGQLVERNRVHREFELQHPVAALEAGALEQSSMPVNFGVTTRQLRFTRTSSRNYSAENALEGVSSRLPESDGTLQRARSGELVPDLAEREITRRTSLKDFETLGNSNNSHDIIGSVSGAGDRVLRSSQARVFSSFLAAKEGPKSALEVYKDHSPGIAASALSSVDESGQDILSPVLRKVTLGTLGRDDCGKENRDPQGELDGMARRSPLPEWHSRKPLQDITDVLAAALCTCQNNDQQPQPKKKLKKKVNSVVAPSFPTLSETPTRRKDSAITQPKCPSFATPKQFSNLGKNFR